MSKRRKLELPASGWDSETRLLAWLATVVAVLSFLFYFRNGEVMLYGDAIAHINIARRVFDSKTPGLLQLGTVWLPLPHLLIIPFIVSMRMWQTGAGGSIPSMAGYVFAVIGIFRLTRSALRGSTTPETAVKATAKTEAQTGARTGAQTAGWIAALVLAANPNLIYMQSTAMGESLYLAFFLWAVVFFVESPRDSKALIKCGLCLAGACLTRYDGWFLAAAMVGIVVLQAIFFADKPRSPKLSKSAALKFLLIAAAAPALWFAYNGIVYHNPLEFENGPYSAKAIERRTQSTANPGHPGSGNLLLAGMYFVKSAEDNIAQNQWLQRIWILLTLAALVAVLYFGLKEKNPTSDQTSRPDKLPDSVDPRWLGFLSPPALALLLLLIPVPFYALSVAYGGVPIFVPQWWPFSHYNLRYGLQLIPAFAMALALAAYFILQSKSWNPRLRAAGFLAVFALLAASYATIWYAGPACLEEAQLNMRTRNQLQADLATWIDKLPPNATLLMYLGDQVGALERAGFPLKQTINEGNHRVWKQPTDPKGLWERALADPSKYADYVLVLDGDPVWQAVHNLHLPEIVEIHVSGQPRAILYRAR
ncbi:MAG: hypothetical protein WAM79_06530 [Candidatus Sulfotelmatobacter sp.]